jgi:hypothetical protein
MEKFLDKVNAAVASGNPMTGVTPTATPPSDLDVDMKMADVGGIPFTQIRGVNGNPSFAERLLNAQSGQSSFSQRLQGVLDNHAFAADTVNRGDLARGFAAAGMLQGDRGSQGFWKDLGMSILSAPGVMPLLETIDAPRRFVTSTLKETIDLYQGEGFSGEDWFNQAMYMEHQVGVGDFVDTGNIWLDRALGFIGDVALDPLTYVSLGTSAVIKAGSANLADRAFRAGVDDIGRKILQNHYQRLSRLDWQRLGDADEALVRSVVDDAGNAINPNYVTDLRGGARLNIGRTRVGKKVANVISGGKRNEYSLAIGGKTISHALGRTVFHPLGSFHNLRAAKLARKVIHGDFVTGDRQAARKLMETGSDVEVRDAYYMMREANDGSRIEKAFGTKAAQDWRALSTDLKAKGYSGQDLMMTMDSNNALRLLADDDWARLKGFADGIVDSANTHANRHFLVGRENWFPKSRVRNDLSDALGAATARTGFSKQHFEKVAKVIEGNEFMGQVLVAGKNHPEGLGPVAQAWEIYSKHVIDQGGVAPASRWFSDDIYEAMPSYLESLSRRVGEHRTLDGLERRGIARSLWESSDTPLGTKKQQRAKKNAAAQIHRQREDVWVANRAKNRHLEDVRRAKQAEADVTASLDEARRVTETTAKRNAQSSVTQYGESPVTAAMLREAVSDNPTPRIGPDGNVVHPQVVAQFANPMDAIDKAIVDVYTASLDVSLEAGGAVAAKHAHDVAHGVFGRPVAEMVELQRKMVVLQRRLGKQIDLDGAAQRAEEASRILKQSQAGRRQLMLTEGEVTTGYSKEFHAVQEELRDAQDEVWEYAQKLDAQVTHINSTRLGNRGSFSAIDAVAEQSGSAGLIPPSRPIAADKVRVDRGEGFGVASAGAGGAPTPQHQIVINRARDFETFGAGLDRQIRSYDEYLASADAYQRELAVMEDLERAKRADNAIVDIGKPSQPIGPRTYIRTVDMPEGPAKQAAHRANREMLANRPRPESRAAKRTRMAPRNLADLGAADVDGALIQRGMDRARPDGRAFVSDGSHGSPTANQIVSSTDPGVAVGDFVYFNVSSFTKHTTGEFADSPVHGNFKITGTQVNKAIVESKGRGQIVRKHKGTGLPIIRLENGVEFPDQRGFGKVVGYANTDVPKVVNPKAPGWRKASTADGPARADRVLKDIGDDSLARKKNETHPLRREEPTFMRWTTDREINSAVERSHGLPQLRAAAFDELSPAQKARFAEDKAARERTARSQDTPPLTREEFIASLPESQWMDIELNGLSEAQLKRFERENRKRAALQAEKDTINPLSEAEWMETLGYQGDIHSRAMDLPPTIRKQFVENNQARISAEPPRPPLSMEEFLEARKYQANHGRRPWTSERADEIIMQQQKLDDLNSRLGLEVRQEAQVPGYIAGHRSKQTGEWIKGAKSAASPELADAKLLRGRPSAVQSAETEAAWLNRARSKDGGFELYGETAPRADYSASNPWLDMQGKGGRGVALSEQAPVRSAGGNASSATFPLGKPLRLDADNLRAARSLAKETRETLANYRDSFRVGSPDQAHVSHLEARLRDISAVEEEAAMRLASMRSAEDAYKKGKATELAGREQKALREVHLPKKPGPGDEGLIRIRALDDQGNTVDSNIFWIDRSDVKHGAAHRGISSARAHIGSSAVHDPARARIFNETGDATGAKFSFEMENPRVVGEAVAGGPEINNLTRLGHSSSTAEAVVDQEMFVDAMLAHTGTFVAGSPKRGFWSKPARAGDPQGSRFVDSEGVGRKFRARKKGESLADYDAAVKAAGLRQELRKPPAVGSEANPLPRKSPAQEKRQLTPNRIVQAAKRVKGHLAGSAATQADSALVKAAKEADLVVRKEVQAELDYWARFTHQTDQQTFVNDLDPYLPENTVKWVDKNGVVYSPPWKKGANTSWAAYKKHDRMKKWAAQQKKAGRIPATTLDPEKLVEKAVDLDAVAGSPVVSHKSGDLVDPDSIGSNKTWAQMDAEEGIVLDAAGRRRLPGGKYAPVRSRTMPKTEPKAKPTGASSPAFIGPPSPPVTIRRARERYAAAAAKMDILDDARAVLDRSSRREMVNPLGGRVQSNLTAGVPEHVRISQAYTEVWRWKQLQAGLAQVPDNPKAQAAVFGRVFGDVFDERRFSGTAVDSDQWIMNRVVHDAMGTDGFMPPKQRADAASLYRERLAGDGFDGLWVKNSEGKWKMHVLDETQAKSVGDPHLLDAASGRVFMVEGNSTPAQAFDSLNAQKAALELRIHESKVASSRLAFDEFAQAHRQTEYLGDAQGKLAEGLDRRIARSLDEMSQLSDGGGARVFDDVADLHERMVKAKKTLEESARWKDVARTIQEGVGRERQDMLNEISGMSLREAEDALSGLPPRSVFDGTDSVANPTNEATALSDQILWQQRQQLTNNNIERGVNRQNTAEANEALAEFQAAIAKSKIAELEATAALAVADWETKLAKMVKKEPKNRAKVSEIEARIEAEHAAWGDKPGRRLNSEGGREQLRKAMQDYTKIDESLEVPEWAAKALLDQYHISDPTKGMSRTLAAFDTATQFFKGWAMFTTGFHVRNLFGGMFNNFLAGVPAQSYADFQPGFRAYSEALRGGPRRSVVTGQRGARKTTDEALEIGVKAIRRKAEAAGDLSEAQFLEDAFRFTVNDGHLSGAGMSSEITSRAGDALTWNPLRRGFRGVQKNREMGGQVEHWLRGNLAFERIVSARRGLKDVPTGVNPRTGQDWAEEVMYSARQSATDDVIKFHFDYDDLSKFERNTVRRVVPFYTWTRKNLPLQIEMLLTKPGAYSRWAHLDRNVEIGQAEFDLMPDYLEDQLNIRMPFGDEDEPWIWTPEVPWKDLTRTLEPSQILSSFNPILRAPVEIALNKKAYSIGQDTASGGSVNWGMTPLPSYFENITEAIPGFQQAAVGLGVGGYADNGTFVMHTRAQYLLESNLPMYGRIARLAPNSSEESEYRRANAADSWMSTILGVGLHRVNKFEQESAVKNRERRAVNG